jgi:hypothetical protein
MELFTAHNPDVNGEIFRCRFTQKDLAPHTAWHRGGVAGETDCTLRVWQTEVGNCNKSTNARLKQEAWNLRAKVSDL